MKAIVKNPARIVNQPPYSHTKIAQDEVVEVIGDVLDDGCVAVRYGKYNYLVNACDLEVIEDEKK